jgi:formate dehydrogenase subunit gamma
MTDAYRAMRYGNVDASWGKHHHLRWYDDVAAGRAREKFVQPDAVPDKTDTAPALKQRPV